MPLWQGAVGVMYRAEDVDEIDLEDCGLGEYLDYLDYLEYLDEARCLILKIVD